MATELKEEKSGHLNFPLALREVGELDFLFNLVKRGVLTAESHVGLINALQNFKSEDVADAQKSDIKFEERKKRAEELAEFAKKEIANGLSSLHSLFVVRLCTALEVTIEEIVCLALLRPEIWRQSELISKISGPLIQFLNSSENERAHFLYDELRIATKASSSVGVGRFEALLEPVGLGDGVEDGVRKELLELIEARHVIVHRSGKIDQKFKGRCPWIPENIGDIVKIDTFRYHGFMVAVLKYLANVYLRGCEVGLLNYSQTTINNIKVVVNLTMPEKKPYLIGQGKTD